MEGAFHFSFFVFVSEVRSTPVPPVPPNLSSFLLAMRTLFCCQPKQVEDFVSKDFLINQNNLRRATDYPLLPLVIWCLDSYLRLLSFRQLQSCKLELPVRKVDVSMLCALNSQMNSFRWTDTLVLIFSSRRQCPYRYGKCTIDLSLLIPRHYKQQCTYFFCPTHLHRCRTKSRELKLHVSWKRKGMTSTHSLPTTKVILKTR
jgi:hypothetical protein